MYNINLDDGYKEFTINNDPNRVIRFNPTDFNIVTRIDEATQNIEKRIRELQNMEESTLKEASEVTKAADKIIREEIDKVFNSNVSDVVFGNQFSMSPVGGKMLWERFLEAAGKYIAAEVEKEVKESAKRIGKYTKVVRK